MNVVYDLDWTTALTIDRVESLELDHSEDIRFGPAHGFKTSPSSGRSDCADQQTKTLAMPSEKFLSKAAEIKGQIDLSSVPSLLEGLKFPKFSCRMRAAPLMVDLAVSSSSREMMLDAPGYINVDSRCDRREITIASRCETGRNAITWSIIALKPVLPVGVFALSVFRGEPAK